MLAGRHRTLTVLVIIAVLCGPHCCLAASGWGSRHFDNSFRPAITSVLDMHVTAPNRIFNTPNYKLFKPDEAAADSASKLIGLNAQTHLAFQKKSLKRDLFLIDYKSVNYMYTLYFTGQSVEEQYEMLKMLLEIKKSGP